MTGNSSQVVIGGTPLMNRKTSRTIVSAMNSTPVVHTTESGMMIRGNWVLRTMLLARDHALVARAGAAAKAPGRA